MAGADQHGNPRHGGGVQPLREGVQRGDRPLRIDHILTRDMSWIDRNPTFITHEMNQFQERPVMFGVKAQQHPWVPGREEPITAQARLPARGHGPGEPRRQQMRAQRGGTQHANDAGGSPPPPAGEQPQTPRLA